MPPSALSACLVPAIHPMPTTAASKKRMRSHSPDGSEDSVHLGLSGADELLLEQAEATPKNRRSQEHRDVIKRARMIRNRVAAQTSRDKKRRSMEDLEQTNKVLTDRLADVERNNAALMAQVASLAKTLAGLSNQPLSSQQLSVPSLPSPASQQQQQQISSSLMIPSPCMSGSGNLFSPLPSPAVSRSESSFSLESPDTLSNFSDFLLLQQQQQQQQQQQHFQQHDSFYSSILAEAKLNDGYGQNEFYTGGVGGAGGVSAGCSGEGGDALDFLDAFLVGDALPTMDVVDYDALTALLFPTDDVLVSTFLSL
ncbi:hypothetical protein BJ741DRAFT_711984 [Chytriomyces cf. hyalinus JEL632]|nr:hypothetical protein BJ741DRAFT_711984 [Chytriomyces cf. hyalinus JEL632]